MGERERLTWLADRSELALVVSRPDRSSRSRTSVLAQARLGCSRAGEVDSAVDLNQIRIPYSGTGKEGQLGPGQMSRQKQQRR